MVSVSLISCIYCLSPRSSAHLGEPTTSEEDLQLDQQYASGEYLLEVKAALSQLWELENGQQS